MTRSTRQTTLTQFFKPNHVNPSEPSMDKRPVEAGRAFIDVEAGRRYNWITSEEDDSGEEGEAGDTTGTCVPTEWRTGNINTAYEQLLR